MYAIVFEYRVPPGGEEPFERAYGGDGEWARFFREADGYLGTDLHRHVDVLGRYVLVDRWASEEAYRTFMERRRDEFEAQNERTADLWELEVRFGGLTVPET